MSKVKVDQLNQLREIFKRFDMDSDGSLAMLELAALIRSLGVKLSGDEVQILVAKMDSNGNGFVEFDELVGTIMPNINAEVLVNQEQLIGVFKCFDRDGNGFISAAELAGAMAKMGQPLTVGTKFTLMIKEADMDGDGVISFSEFATIMARSASDLLGGFGYRNNTHSFQL
ncbi:putative calcium-binding protein cml14 [Trifolium repens]|nr:putative calcium-binding protein cml14 [Trifolium repens]